MQYVRADEVQVGDTIWKEQDMVVTRVRILSVSTAIYAQRIGRVGPEFGGSEWLLENWYQVPVTRPDIVERIEGETDWERSLIDLGGEG